MPLGPGLDATLELNPSNVLSAGIDATLELNPSNVLSAGIDMPLSGIPTTFSGPVAEENLEVLEDKFSGPIIEENLDQLESTFSGPVLDILSEQSEGNNVSFSTTASYNLTISRSANTTLQLNPISNGSVPTQIMAGATSTFQFSPTNAVVKNIFTLGCTMFNMGTINGLGRIVSASTTLELGQNANGPATRLANADHTLQFGGTAGVGFTAIILNADTTLELGPSSDFFQLLEVNAETTLGLGSMGLRCIAPSAARPLRKIVKIKNIGRQTLPIRALSTGKVQHLPPGDVITVDISDIDIAQFARFRDRYWLLVDP